ncbi:MAG: ABC transporter ATP-binding protein [Bacteroidia bacterium]|nr:ABC transporter ATP-binding protein [Bacteroidia bacterium]
MDKENIFRIRDLTRTYRKRKITIPAIKGVSLDINEGEIISIIGRSGSGKSTLLNLLGGLDSATSGTIVFKGKNLPDMSRSELVKYRRFAIGMIFQSFNLVPGMTARENIELALRFAEFPRRQRKTYAMGLLEKVGLKDRSEHFPSELSGGEAQRVAIARALANKPQVLLADEPTGNLDSITSSEIITILKEMNTEQDKTIIIVTHDREMAESVSDRIVRLSDGQIAESFEIQRNGDW